MNPDEILSDLDDDDKIDELGPFLPFFDNKIINQNKVSKRFGEKN